MVFKKKSNNEIATHPIQLKAHFATGIYYKTNIKKFSRFQHEC